MNEKELSIAAGGFVYCVFKYKFLSLNFRVFYLAAGYADKSNYWNCKDSKKRCFTAHMILHLNTYKRAYRHTYWNCKRKSAYAFGYFSLGKNITCKCHSCRAANRIYRAHIKADYDKHRKNRKRYERRKCKAEKSQKNNINNVAVKIVKQITCPRVWTEL